MGSAHDKQTYGLGDDESCPECSHAWTLDGPAHFIDCRYFSFDDDRDEEQPVCLWGRGCEMVIDELQKVAA